MSCTKRYMGYKVGSVGFFPVLNQSTAEVRICTGSWDEPENRLSVCRVVSDTADTVQVELLSQIKHVHDVMDLHCPSPDCVVSASGSGSVYLYSYVGNSLQCSGEFKSSECAVNKVYSVIPDVVSCGEDGSINVSRLERGGLDKYCGKRDTCAVNGLNVNRNLEVVTANAAGQLKLWDTRASWNGPERTLSVAGGTTVGLLCVDRHSYQQHSLATGSVDGRLCFWDLRKEGTPVVLLEGNSSPIWDLRFNPNQPEFLYSCSGNGAVWQWNVSNGDWLATELERRLDIVPILSPSAGTETMSVNSLDILGDIALCGSDDESIYIFTGIV